MIYADQLTNLIVRFLMQYYLKKLKKRKAAVRKCEHDAFKTDASVTVKKNTYSERLH